MSTDSSPQSVPFAGLIWDGENWHDPRVESVAPAQRRPIVDPVTRQTHLLTAIAYSLLAIVLTLAALIVTVAVTDVWGAVAIIVCAVAAGVFAVASIIEVFTKR